MSEVLLVCCIARGGGFEINSMVYLHGSFKFYFITSLFELSFIRDPSLLK